MKSTKQKPVALFDIDGTIFRNSLFIELHWKMVKEGIVPRSAITKLDKKYWQWVTRKGSYDEYLDEVIGSFNKFIKGVPVATIERLGHHVVKNQSNIVYRYTRDLIESLRKTHLLVAISGSQHVVVAEFAKVWGFDYFIGTEHEISGRKFTGKVSWVASADKKKALEKLQAKYGFKLGKGSIAVGDTESDVPTLSLVERAICFNPTSGLYKVAKKNGWEVVVERKDLILKIKKGRILE
jgi:HAD superfamily hydrolase (TIGR01490 family)